LPLFVTQSRVTSFHTASTGNHLVIEIAVQHMQ